MSPFAGRTRTHRLDLELLFWAALMWSCRCPSSALYSPFLTASVPQNTFLDTNKPSIPFPDSTEMHKFVLKPCFSTVNSLERIVVLPISYLPFMKRRGRTLMKWTIPHSQYAHFLCKQLHIESWSSEYK
ncbi:hypothetical protein PAMP_000529 [Pampus punctatissimus]